MPVAEPIPELMPVPLPTPAATIASPLPEFVPGRSFSQEDIYNFTEVSAGYDHSCGLRSDGTILCWGNGRNGETEPPEGAFTAVSAGDGYTCGIKTDGSVACWGIWGITFGMPVFETSTHRRPESPTGLFKAISAGEAHACGIKADDTLECWGENRVSAGDFSREAGQATPPPGTFLSISATGSTSCGVTTDNQVVCWGAGYEGAESPVEGQFLSVSAGGWHSCGVRTDNTVVCWGDNLSGRITPPDAKFASVSVGGDNTCGVTMAGEVQCWGSYLRNPAPQGEFRSINASGSHRCAVRSDGAVVCWGNNYGFDTLGLKAGITCGVLPNRSAVCPEEDGYDLLATVHASEWVEYFEHNGETHPCGNNSWGTEICWDPVKEAFIGPPNDSVTVSEPTPTPDIWLLPLRDRLELLKQEPGPLAANVRNLDMIYRIVGMMTEAEQGAMVEETELLLEELGPPKGKARTHTYAHIWLGLIEAFASSLDDFNNFRSISEFRLRVHFYVFLPEYLPAGFRYDGVGISGGGGWGDDASGWTIHFSRSPEWYPQMESGAYERITFNQSTNQQKGNPFRGILPRIGGGEKIVLPNLEAAGIDDVRYWLGYSEWGAGGKDQYYQVAWEDPETDSFTHVISSLSQEETFKVVGSIR